MYEDGTNSQQREKGVDSLYTLLLIENPLRNEKSMIMQPVPPDAKA